LPDDHHRFRLRIDRLTDQRDQAIERAERSERKLEQCRRVRAKFYNRMRLVEASRELWRQRAMQQPARKRIVPSERAP
jgi:hypothetical protein